MASLPLSIAAPASIPPGSSSSSLSPFPLPLTVSQPLSALSAVLSSPPSSLSALPCPSPRTALLDSQHRRRLLLKELDELDRAESSFGSSGPPGSSCASAITTAHHRPNLQSHQDLNPMASDTQGSSCSPSREDSEHTRVQKSISQAKSSSGSREKREKRVSMDSEAIFPIFSHHQNQERSRQLNTAQQTKTTSGLNEERQSAAPSTPRSKSHSSQRNRGSDSSTDQGWKNASEQSSKARKSAAKKKTSKKGRERRNSSVDMSDSDANRGSRRGSRSDGDNQNGQHRPSDTPSQIGPTQRKRRAVSRMHIQSSPECSLILHVNGPRSEFLRTRPKPPTANDENESSCSSSSSTPSRATGGSSALQAAQRVLLSSRLCNTVAGSLPPVLNAVYLPQRPIELNGKDEKMDHDESEDHHRILVTFASNEAMMKVKNAVESAGVGSTEAYRDPVVRGQVSTTIWLHSSHIKSLHSELQQRAPSATFTLAPLDKQGLGRTIFFQIPARAETQLLDIPREWCGLSCRVGLMVKVRDRHQQNETACRRCFSRQHLVGSCPIDRDSAPCATCGQTGHRSQQCPMPFDNRRCLICKEVHPTLRCTSITPALCSLDRNRLHQIKDKLLSQSGHGQPHATPTQPTQTQTVHSSSTVSATDSSDSDTSSETVSLPNSSVSTPTYSSVVSRGGNIRRQTQPTSTQVELEAQTKGLWDAINSLRAELQTRKELEDEMKARFAEERKAWTSAFTDVVDMVKTLSQDIAKLTANIVAMQSTQAQQSTNTPNTPNVSGKRSRMSEDTPKAAKIRPSPPSRSSSPAQSSSQPCQPTQK